MEEDYEVELSRPKPYQPSPSHKTLLDLASTAAAKHKATEQERPTSEDVCFEGRLAEATLWTSTLTMLHFTLDLLVTHQYATEINWDQILWRAIKAFPVILLLTYAFHPHSSPPIFLPTCPPRFHYLLHQSSFFLVSLAAGGYLIHTTNVHPYYAIMKRVPPMGCLWVLSMIELELLLALSSVACCGLLLKLGGYSLI